MGGEREGELGGEGCGRGEGRAKGIEGHGGASLCLIGVPMISAWKGSSAKGVGWGVGRGVPSPLGEVSGEGTKNFATSMGFYPALTPLGTPLLCLKFLAPPLTKLL